MLFFFTVFQYKSSDAEACPLYCLVSNLENIQVGNLMCYLLNLISIIDTSGSDTRVETLAEARYPKWFITERNRRYTDSPPQTENRRRIFTVLDLIHSASSQHPYTKNVVWYCLNGNRLTSHVECRGIWFGIDRYQRYALNFPYNSRKHEYMNAKFSGLI